MKKKIIIAFILGIIISSVISTYISHEIITKEVSYKDDKELMASGDTDYITGIYSSSNTLSSNITNLSVNDLLINSTTTANATKQTYNYVSVSNLSKYRMAVVRVTAGNVTRNLVCVNGDGSQQYLMEGNMISSTTSIRTGLHCDWSNNRVGVAYFDPVSGYTYSYAKVERVYGLLKKN